MKKILDWFSHGAWFDFGREVGIREENERIVKLITETHKGLLAVMAMAKHDGDGAELIALIKRGNK